MPDVLIRGLSQEAYDYYKKRADSFHRSLNSEIRHTLEKNVGGQLQRDAWAMRMHDMRERLARKWEEEGRTPPSSAELIREDRERDD